MRPRTGKSNRENDRLPRQSPGSEAAGRAHKKGRPSGGLLRLSKKAWPFLAAAAKLYEVVRQAEGKRAPLERRAFSFYDRSELTVLILPGGLLGDGFHHIRSCFLHAFDPGTKACFFGDCPIFPVWDAAAGGWNRSSDPRSAPARRDHSARPVWRACASSVSLSGPDETRTGSRSKPQPSNGSSSAS